MSNTKWLPRLSQIFLYGFAGVIISGLAAVFFPAFGWLPALGGTEFTLDHWIAFFQSPGITKSITLSITTALLTTAISVACVFLFLASISGSNSLIQKFVLRLLAPILSIPHAAAAFGFLFLFSPSGLLSRWLSPELTGWNRPPDLLTVQDPWGLSLAGGLIIKEIPFLLLVAFSVLPQINVDKSLKLARSLGYHTTVGWLKVIAPQLYPLIRMPIFAVLVFSSSTVDVALILGPNLPSTLSVSVTQWFNDPDLSQRFIASVGAVCQLMTTLVVLGIWWIIEQIIQRGFSSYSVNGEQRRFAVIAAFVGRLSVGLVFIVNIAGIFVLIINSIAGFWRFPNNFPAKWTATHFLNAQTAITESLLVTLSIAVITVLIAIVVVIVVLEAEIQTKPSRINKFIIYSPLLIPQVGFISGLVVLSIWLNINPNVHLVILGHLLFVIPYAYLSLGKAYQAFDHRWLQLSRTLGASYWKILFRIKLPMLTTPLLSTLALAFSVSIAQYLATQLLGAGRVSTITTEAIALSSSGNRRLISVWSLCQALLPCLIYLLALMIPKLVWRQRKLMQLH